MFTIQQKAAAVAATGKDREAVAIMAGVSYPTLARFLQNESIHTSNEQKIVSAIRALGWEMRDGGVLPVKEKKDD